MNQFFKRISISRAAFLGGYLLVGVFSPVQPINHQLPDTIGVSTFAALAISSTYFVHQKKEWDTTTKLQAEVATLSGSALVGYLLYKVLSSYTPQGRYTRSREMVDNAERLMEDKKFFSTAVADIVFKTDLCNAAAFAETAFSELGLSGKEIKLRAKIVVLVEKLMGLHHLYAHYHLAQIEEDTRSFDLFSEKSEHYSEEEFIDRVERDYADQNSFIIAQSDMRNARVLIAKARNSLEQILQCSIESDEIERLTLQATETERRIVHFERRIKERLRLLDYYHRYRKLTTCVARFEEHEQVSSLFAESELDDDQFILLVKEGYQEDEWYHHARDDLAHIKLSIDGSLTGLSLLLTEEKNYHCSDNVRYLYERLKIVGDRLTRKFILIEKLTTFFDVQETVTRIMLREKVGQILVSDADRLTDGQLWAWAEREYGMRWWTHVRNDIKRIYDELIYAEQNLTDALKDSQEASFDEECFQLQRTLTDLINLLGRRNALFVYHGDYERVRRRIDVLISRSSFEHLFDHSNDDLSSAEIVDILHAMFVRERWPLVSADEQLVTFILNVSTLLRDAVSLRETSMTNDFVAHLVVKGCELEQKMIHLSNRASTVRALLIESEEFKDQVSEKEEYERDERNRLWVAIRAQEEAVENQLEQQREQAAENGLDTECPICLESPSHNSVVMVLQCCGGHHFVCQSCYERLRVGQNRCPLCRAEVPPIVQVRYSHYVVQR